MGVDIVGDPHREDNDGCNWTVLRYARNVTDVTPGSTVVMGSVPILADGPLAVASAKSGAASR